MKEPQCCHALLIIAATVSYSHKIFIGLSLGSVTRQLEKNAKVFLKSSQINCRAKKAKISVSKPYLKVQNNYIKSLPKLKRTYNV